MRVMGFDVASKRTGWAAYDGRTWQCGLLKFAGSKPAGDMLNAAFDGDLLDWQATAIHQLIGIHQPDAAAIEEPLLASPGVKTNGATLHLLNATAANAARVCRAARVPVAYVNQSSWRKAFGVKRLTVADRKAPNEGGVKDDWLKKEAARIARLLGANPLNYDAAEACGVAFWAYGENTRRDLFSSPPRRRA